MTELTDFRAEINRLSQGQILTAKAAQTPATGFENFSIADANAFVGTLCFVTNNAVHVEAVRDNFVVFSADEGNKPFEYILLGQTGQATGAQVAGDRFLQVGDDDEFLAIGGGENLRI